MAKPPWGVTVGPVRFNDGREIHLVVEISRTRRTVIVARMCLSLILRTARVMVTTVWRIWRGGHEQNQDAMV